jgi:UDP-N-acetylmuramate dehydrogenase
MQLNTDVSLKPLNTFRVDALAADYVRFDAPDEIVEYLHRHPLRTSSHLVLGGGSNLLFVDDVDGIVLHPLLKGIDVVDADRSHIWVRAMAGEVWDDLVAFAVANGWGGIENLSLIPGSVGASAVQNIGAYGVEVKTVIDCVEAVCLVSGKPVNFAPPDCRFAYRTSSFKGPWAGRYIITAVVFKLARQPGFVLDYPGVCETVNGFGEISLDTVRRAIIAIRQGKLPDPRFIGNAGSFFKNPVVAREAVDDLLHRFPDLPRYPQGGGRVKLAAGWLIERCGWKGRRVGCAAVHDKQALVLVNLGGATGAEILALSERIRQSIWARFGVDLEREVQVVAMHSGRN